MSSSPGSPPGPPGASADDPAGSTPSDAAGPPLLPPGTRSRSHGFRVGKKAEFSVEDPMANSSMLPLPTRTAPSS